MRNLLAPTQQLTQHAESRMSQRGYKKHDLELIRLFGTPVQEGYLLTRSDVKTLTKDLQRLERMEGTLLVEQSGKTITMYRPTKKRRRRVMYQDGRRYKRNLS